MLYLYSILYSINVINVIILLSLLFDRSSKHANVSSKHANVSSKHANVSSKHANVSSILTNYFILIYIQHTGIVLLGGKMNTKKALTVLQQFVWTIVKSNYTICPIDQIDIYSMIYGVTVTYFLEELNNFTVDDAVKFIVLSYNDYFSDLTRRVCKTGVLRWIIN